MVEFIGSTDGIINWDKIINEVRLGSGDPISINGVSDRFDTEEINVNDYRSLFKIWIDARYNLNEIQWTNFYPKEHFESEIEKLFGEIVNCKPLRTFICRIDPGRSVPYHWDIEDKEQEWISEGELVRFTCFIDEPKFGHVFVVKDHCFYNEEKHKIYKWDNYKDFHGATNCGSDPYYMYQYLGLKI